MGKELVSVENSEEVIITEIDKDLVSETRKKFPFLNDIRMI